MKIIKNRPFKATVKVAYPGDAYSADDSFVGHFVALDREALKGLQGALLTDEGQDAYLDQIFTGWEGLVDSTDAPFEVTPENRKGPVSYTHLDVYKRQIQRSQVRILPPQPIITEITR